MKHKLLKHKFKQNIVKPLYRKVTKYVRTPNLDGHDFHRKRFTGCEILDRKTQDSFLPGTCELYCTTVLYNVYNFRDTERVMEFSYSGGNGKQDKLVLSGYKRNNVSVTWLQVYPLPKKKGDSIGCTIFRCVASQLGLATILVLWTVLWMFVIHIFEGPYEEKVAKDFEDEQHQLVIDLATELRQITPISSRWREAIELRLREERELTVQAVARGAKLLPGQFWNLSGCFLFTIYVMTALGFGAPVPQTACGRSAAMIYALVAVPTHFYLMLNASACFVAKCNALRCPMFGDHRNKHDSKDNPACTTSSEALKTSKCYRAQKNIMRCLSLLAVCRCIPVVVLLYYGFGAVAFGVLRHLTPLDSVMFPIQFTTTGGLENVESHFRILYGFYVEGAMALLSVVFETLRRSSSEALTAMTQKYRLFHTHSS